YPDHIVDQQHLPEKLKGRQYFSPSDSGYEKTIQERMKMRDEKKGGKRAARVALTSEKPAK
ncbi:MAG: hypothetical protein GTO51_00975, partial [Candidatus Latescibacteria bacterium]|nr:hypothetical protein [Candidatus Latescibacterota bacterium]NIM64551.1 hypothetical protein [Candidatus Latescibacterota bacterium]NIO01066.1 hypothetical protein [Candidatus Latescibacterota bacterium]NIT01079.1 hypothetical protein [Candidatus Latescibacterota bacterium]